MTMSTSPKHLSSEEFRQQGYAFVDWIAEYYERVGELPVAAQVKPGDVSGQLPLSPPESGESLSAVLKDMDEIILPVLPIGPPRTSSHTFRLTPRLQPYWETCCLRD